MAPGMNGMAMSKSMSYGGRGQPTPGMEKGGLGDTLSGMNNITWRTDDNDDDEDDARQIVGETVEPRTGICFEKGWGCEINVDQALFWYRKAAVQGDQYAINAVERLA